MAIFATNKGITSKAEYPKLMKSKTSGTVVLFISDNEGTVILCTENMGYSIGMHLIDWSMQGFEEFKGTVELTNDY